MNSMMSAGVKLIYTTLLETKVDKYNRRVVGVKFDGSVWFAKYILSALEKNKVGH
jgi:hypothetical protein